MRAALLLVLACQSGGDSAKPPPPADDRADVWTTVDVLACRYTIKMPGQARRVDNRFESGGLVAKCVDGPSDDAGVRAAAQQEVDAVASAHGGIDQSRVDLLGPANARYTVLFRDAVRLEGRAIGKGDHVHVLAGIVTSEDERHDFARMLGTYKAF